VSLRSKPPQRARHARRNAFALVSATLALLLQGDGGVAWAQADTYRCPITFVVEDARFPPIGIIELDFDVSYVIEDIGFEGRASTVDCTVLATGATATFEDDDAGLLGVEVDSAAGISSLISPLARCTTLSAEIPVASDFAVTIVKEKKVGGTDVVPPVAVQMLLPELDDCLLVTTTTSTTSITSTTLPSASCADPTGDSATTATDALLTLNAAVGLTPCALCACDVDGSTAVTASDALFILSYAVGQPVELDCPPCS
jgi:hypothetical protein